MTAPKLDPAMVETLPTQFSEEEALKAEDMIDISYTNTDLYLRNQIFRFDNVEKGTVDLSLSTPIRNEILLKLEHYNGILPLLKSLFRIKIVSANNDASENRVCLENVHALINYIRIYDEKNPKKYLTYSNDFLEREILLDNFYVDSDREVRGLDYGTDCYGVMAGTNPLKAAVWDAGLKTTTYEYYYNPFISLMRSGQFKQFDKAFNLKQFSLVMAISLNSIQRAFTYAGTVTAPSVQVTITPEFDVYNFEQAHPLMRELSLTSYKLPVKRVHIPETVPSNAAPLSFKTQFRCEKPEGVILSLVRQSDYLDTSLHGRYDRYDLIMEHVEKVRLTIDHRPFVNNGSNGWVTVDKLYNKKELLRMLGDDGKFSKELKFHTWGHQNVNTGSETVAQQDAKMHMYFDLSLFTNAISTYQSPTGELQKILNFEIHYKNGWAPTDDSVIVKPRVFVLYTDFAVVDNVTGSIAMESEEYLM